MPIIIVLVALAAAGWLGFMAAAGAQSHLVVLAASCLVGLFAFFSPRLSLTLLVFSMLLSPEIGLGAVSGSRSLVVRYDDILLVIIFMAWFATWTAKPAFFHQNIPSQADPDSRSTT